MKLLFLVAAAVIVAVLWIATAVPASAASFGDTYETPVIATD